MKKLLPIVSVSVCTLLIVIALFPYYYMLINSLLPWKLVDKSLLPKELSLESYRYLLIGADGNFSFVWIRALLNSFIVSFFTALCTLAVSLASGYAQSCLSWRGKPYIQAMLLFQMFFPVIILLVPRYLLVSPLANSFFGMILPLSVSVWGIFMYINHFKTVPASVFEAARIDGAGAIRILICIALPASKSISVIVFLTVFMQRWNELMWDMLIAPRLSMQTLNVMISTQFNQQSALPGPMYAASVILSLPLIILFLCFAKQVKEGVNFMLK